MKLLFHNVRYLWIPQVAINTESIAGVVIVIVMADHAILIDVVFVGKSHRQYIDRCMRVGIWLADTGRPECQGGVQREYGNQYPLEQSTHNSRFLMMENNAIEIAVTSMMASGELVRKGRDFLAGRNSAVSTISGIKPHCQIVLR